MKKIFRFILVCLPSTATFILGLACCTAQNPGVNLVVNSSFETGGQNIAREFNSHGWTFFVIEEPAKGGVTNEAQDGNACFEIRAEGGRGFLHSDPFPVKPSFNLNISLWIKGSGEAAVEILWWKEYNDDIVIASDRHRDVLKTADAFAEWKKLTMQAGVPEDARFAYIRLIARKADVAFDDISVTTE